MSDELQVSRWCKSSIRGDAISLIHSLTLDLVFLSEPQGSTLLSVVRKGVSRGELTAMFGELINQLVAKRLLVSNAEQDDDILHRFRLSLIENVRMNLCYLLLTDGCNLQCRYCFEDTPDAPSFKATRMDSTVISCGLEMFARLTSRYGDDKSTKRVIHLYGGEPLTNAPGVRMAVKKTEELQASGSLPDNTELVIVTNGTLLTRDMALFFADHQVTVGISLDGPRHINDLHRIEKRRNDGTFEKAQRAYKLALECGAKINFPLLLPRK